MSAVEIRWHARGGQDLAAAARMTAELARRRGRHFQSLQTSLDDGPERLGEPVVAFSRVSDEPINVQAVVEHPDVVVVLDPSLLRLVDVTEGARRGATILVNSESAAPDLCAKLGWQEGRLYAVPADRIGAETVGRPMPHTSMLAALARITDLPLAELVEVVRGEMEGGYSPAVVERTVAALERCYREVRPA